MRKCITLAVTMIVYLFIYNLFIYILPRNRPATEQRVESDAIVLICKNSLSRNRE